MKKYSITFLASLITLFSIAQVPNGYYNYAMYKDGDTLRMALSEIIDFHTVVQYSNLWSKFNFTDKDANGKVWDIYSDNPSGANSYTYSFGTNQCGQYSAEGDCYNREHSMPKSWFNDASPMESDLFHIYPTDGWVNGKRGSLPYGEVTTASYTSSNGSKVGANTYPGSSGQCFEPIDEYKGDIARTYFYMVTRYRNSVSGWNSSMLSGNTLAPWALEMLLEWHDADSVSQKEIDRNNAIYNIQGNRNPFIDSTIYVEYIWRGKEAPPVGIEENNIQQFYYSGNSIYIKQRNILNQDLEIYNVLGTKVKSFEIVKNVQSVDIKLEKGIYIASYGNKKLKFVVE